ncbi:MAG: hypothetical protein WCK17_13115, partial [Verrucomicrobiota bacterium]
RVQAEEIVPGGEKQFLSFLGGNAAPGETGAMSEPDGEVPIVGWSDEYWTFDVIPLFRHYFSQKASWRSEKKGVSSA